MRPEITPRDILYGEDAHTKINYGVETVYNVARAAFGAKAGNVLYEQNWPVGSAKLSRDGVTNLKKVYLKDRTANLAARVIVQASEKNNSTVGDGTTAVAILARNLYQKGRLLVAAGHNRMWVAHQMDLAAQYALDSIDFIKQPISKNDLELVAKVSCGDEGLGALIADTIVAVGENGGITVEEHAGLDVYNEVIDGFFMKKGFSDPRLVQNGSTMSCDFKNVPILLLEKHITNGREMAMLLSKIRGAGYNELVIVGEVSQDALVVLLRMRAEGAMVPTVVGIPAQAGARSVILDDLAILTGGKVYQEGQVASSFGLDSLGAAQQVVIDEYTTTVVSGAGEQDIVKERIKTLEEQLKTEAHPVTIGFLKERIGRLKGKVGIIKVGAATDIEREELRLRVDDAVCALQAARKEGTVPGGHTALARVEDDLFGDAYRGLFLELMRNAGERGDLFLEKTLAAPVDFGYDLRNMTPEPINMREAGILDPALVVKEIVRNATSVASKLITVSATIAFSEEEEKHAVDNHRS